MLTVVFSGMGSVRPSRIVDFVLAIDHNRNPTPIQRNRDTPTITPIMSDANAIRTYGTRRRLPQHLRGCDFSKCRSTMRTHFVVHLQHSHCYVVRCTSCVPTPTYNKVPDKQGHPAYRHISCSTLCCIGHSSRVSHVGFLAHGAIIWAHTNGRRHCDIRYFGASSLR